MSVSGPNLGAQICEKRQVIVVSAISRSAKPMMTGTSHPSGKTKIATRMPVTKITPGA